MIFTLLNMSSYVRLSGLSTIKGIMSTTERERERACYKYLNLLKRDYHSLKTDMSLSNQLMYLSVLSSNLSSLLYNTYTYISKPIREGEREREKRERP